MQRFATQWLLLTLVSIACACTGASHDRSAPAAKPAPKTPVVPVPPVDEGPPVRLFANKANSRIRAAPSKEAPRIGYLRGGQVLYAKTAKPIGFDDCRKGWYELETGGFICTTVDAIAFSTKRLPARRPTQPDFTKPLPYPYGYSRSKNTPVYRRLPTDEEAALYEGYKIPGAAPPPSAADAGVPVATNAAAVAPTAVAIAPTAAAIAQGVAEAPSEAPVNAPTVTAPEISGNPGAGVPDAGGPPTLASLMGDEDSVLMRRMERGFYVSIDREISKGFRSYWQTQDTGFIPKSRLFMVEGSEFHGIELETAGVTLPIGFVLSKNTQSYTVDAKGRSRGAGRPGYHFAFPITGTADLHGRAFYVGPTGVHYPQKEVAKVELRERPKDVAADEKWIDVDLDTQSLVAYVGDKPVYATLISSGRVKDELDPLRNFETPVGSFRITSKHLTATMDGDHAIDGPYSIQDVPYVMYFQLAYALHSAFWHNSFGRPHSHGCVNLAPIDAKWIFFWTTPELPKGWHGVYPRGEELGTRVIIHGTTPKG
jgi:lipoprotein-anchoring transpeptidase ErfK/SrfK